MPAPAPEETRGGGERGDREGERPPPPPGGPERPPPGDPRPGPASSSGYDDKPGPSAALPPFRKRRPRPESAAPPGSPTYPPILFPLSDAPGSRRRRFYFPWACIYPVSLCQLLVCRVTC